MKLLVLKNTGNRRQTVHPVDEVSCRSQQALLVRKGIKIAIKRKDGDRGREEAGGREERGGGGRQ